MENVKVYIRGWLSYFGIASMKTTMQDWMGGCAAESVCTYGNNGSYRKRG